MAERLGFVRMQPVTILDAGCGTGAALGELHARYPDARLIGLDLAFNMTLAARDRAAATARSARSLLGRVLGPLAPARELRPWCICGDIASLPIKPASIDLIWSNLTLQWIGDPQKSFAEFRRVLRVGGLLSFTTFGPDTLKELRAAFLSADRATHVGRFIDMHDLGDMLVHAGFADPVMDMESLTLTYADAIGLMRDLKAIGAHNVTEGRPRGLMGRQRWRRMLAVHLDGTFYCTRAAVRMMTAQGAGSIVCISSIAGLAGIGPFHYAAAKGGILGLVRSLARDLGPIGIRINAVSPGAIDAGMTRTHKPEVVQAFVPTVPLRRLGHARDIAYAALHLASDESAYTTGQSLSPNGGVVIA